MKNTKKERVALFRYGVIAPLIDLRKTERGEKESLIREITHKEWDIPYSGRSYISRSTVYEWLRRYKKSGRSLESLYPDKRSDMGKLRSMDKETEEALINLKKEFRSASLAVIIKTAKERGVLPHRFKASHQSIYRLFKRYGLDEEDTTKREDIRRYEAEMPNDIWQSDCMHGPKVDVNGNMKKAFLFALIDDHSRIIPHAEFYLRENIEAFTDCFKKALSARGLPRKLYTDNGPTFRSHHLQYITASLGIALIYCRPYRPEGKGKIERWFRTVRMKFLSIIPAHITLPELNERLWKWIDKEYHITVHSSIKEKPIERYLKHLHLIRPAPKDLDSYFRKRVLRKVDKDRTVSLNGRVYEAPLDLIGRKITLLYDEGDLSRIEVFYNEKSYGFLVPLDLHLNARIKRENGVMKMVSEDSNEHKILYEGGKLFEKGEK